MEVSPLIWGLTIAVILGMLAFDYVFHVRKAHEPHIKEAAVWSAIYVGLALLFGLFVLAMWGGLYATEYYAGYITEKALSVDNLFVFLIIMASFKVPRADQQKVLLFGITFALVARTAFIFIGAAAINEFAWVFYIFGAFLIFTAAGLVKGELSGDDDDEADNIIVRTAQKYMRTTDYYDGDKLFTYENGKRVMTPMLLVMVCIGGTDVIFAFDSIPAIFGLTQETYLVFTAVAFSLMGLRQLYFLIDGMLDRLIYLSWGLAIILGFIGYKLIVHALHENDLPFINGGEPVHFPPEVTIGQSLGVIVGVLAVTIVASLLSPKGRALRVVDGLRRVSKEYISLPKDASDAERQKLASKAADLVQKMPNIRQKHRDELIDDHRAYEDLVERARGAHQEYESTGRAPEPVEVDKDSDDIVDKPQPHSGSTRVERGTDD